jgi:hypothetical protein
VYPAQEQQLGEGWPSEAKDNRGRRGAGNCHHLEIGIWQIFGAGTRTRTHQAFILTHCHCGEEALSMARKSCPSWVEGVHNQLRLIWLDESPSFNPCDIQLCLGIVHRHGSKTSDSTMGQIVVARDEIRSWQLMRPNMCRLGRTHYLGRDLGNAVLTTWPSHQLSQHIAPPDCRGVMGASVRFVVGESFSLRF